MSQHVIQQSAGIIQNGTEITPDVLDSLRTELEAMELGDVYKRQLHAFKNHPFEVRDDEEMRAMVSSVKDKGVTQPAIVRPREDGGYEIVSGHRRQKASEMCIRDRPFPLSATKPTLSGRA